MSPRQMKRKLLQNFSEFPALSDKTMPGVLHSETLPGDVQTKVGLAVLLNSCISAIDIEDKS